MEDYEIIALFFRRSEEAVTAASRKYGAYCRSVVTNILSNREDVEECLNDTWLSAWDSIPPNRPQRLGVYLARIARNTALNRRKELTAQKRGGGAVDAVLEELHEMIPGNSAVDEALDEIVLRDAINAFLRSQPKQKRDIFIRRYWAMEPVNDVAKALGLRRGQTATILYRMRRELKEYLEKEGITL